MKWTLGAALLGALFASDVDAVVIKTAGGVMKPKLNRKKCRVMCQRFGMKAMGSDFKGLQPGACMEKCDQVYPSLIQLQLEPTVKIEAAAKKDCVEGEPK